MNLSPARLLAVAAATLVATLGGAASANAETYSHSARPDNGHWCGVAVQGSETYGFERETAPVQYGDGPFVNNCAYFQGARVGLPEHVRHVVSFQIDKSQFIKDFFYGYDRKKFIGSHDFGGGANLNSSENGFNLRGHFYFSGFFKGTMDYKGVQERVYAWWIGTHCTSYRGSVLTGCYS